MQHQSKGPLGNQRMKAAVTHQEKDEEAGQQPLPLHGAVLGEQAPDPRLEEGMWATFQYLPLLSP